MPPETAFAAWQGRTGLTRAADAASVLGVHEVTVYALRRGLQKPSSTMRRLMQILEAYPEIIQRESNVNLARE